DRDRRGLRADTLVAERAGLEQFRHIGVLRGGGAKRAGQPGSCECNGAEACDDMAAGKGHVTSPVAVNGILRALCRCILPKSEAECGKSAVPAATGHHGRVTPAFTSAPRRASEAFRSSSSNSP